MINWGIVGTGHICDQFSSGLSVAKGAKIKAVCSRNKESAQAFAKKHKAETCFSSYEEMAKCPDVDVVYIGTPHVCHLENVKLFLESGKNVLCEKPLGVNTHETIEIIETAKKAGVFFMEGMWTRFFPSIQKAIDWVKSGEIGEVSLITANFGYNGDGVSWRFDNNMAGGALLDVGIYNLAITFSMLGTDYQSINGMAKIINDVDLVSTATIGYKNGAIAMLSCGIKQIMNNNVYIEGTKGRVLIGGNLWWKSKWCELTKTLDGSFGNEAETERFERPYPSTGFQYEAEHVAECLHKGLIESPLMTHDDSINLAKTMDKLRKIYGIKYKQDEK